MTPAEGQNGNYLPTAVDFPVSTESRAWAGTCQEVPPLQDELWEEGLGDSRPGEGGWRAGVSLQGDLVQVKDSKRKGQRWLARAGAQLFPTKCWPEGQGHRVGDIWPWPPWAEKARFTCQGKASSHPSAGSAQLEGHGLSPQAA